MSGDTSVTCAEPFFIAGRSGNIFAMFQPATSSAATRCGVLLVPPFAEEMNKSRRMFALLASSLAERGIASLRFDPYGTGESQGDFGNSRWSAWVQDTQAASGVLAERGCETLAVVGLRAGALLSVASLGSLALPVSSIVVWQPVVSGEAMLTQFLRLRTAASMMGEGQSREGTKALRSRLESGETVEIAGYDLHPEFYAELSALRMSDLLKGSHVPLHWCEVIADAGRGITPVSKRVVEHGQEAGLDINVATVVGAPFWSTVEIAEVTELVAYTTSVIAETCE